MKTNILFAAAALVLSSSAFAHPGHGTAPASDGGRPPHVHFGHAKTPSNIVGKLPSKSVKKPAATHTTPVADKAQRRER